MESHQHWEGQSHFTQPGGNSPPNAPQDSVSVLCSLHCTFLAHVPLAELCFPARHWLLCGVSPPHMQDFALLVELHEVSACLLLQPVKVHLDVSERLLFISHCSQFQSLYLWIHRQFQFRGFFFPLVGGGFCWFYFLYFFASTSGMTAEVK